MKRVTIQVTSKDRSSELCALLHSLRRQTYKAWDIFILDDCYGTPIGNSFKFIHDIIGRLKIEGHGVHLVRNGTSYGVCAARQKLINDDPWKDNPYILRLDDDQVLEDDYLERLVNVMEEKTDAGFVSGVTPNLSGPDFRRSVESVKPVINRVKLNEQGDITTYTDDCGVLYGASIVLPAHNFRSSALMKREMFDKGLAYEKGLTLTGFREEAFLSLRGLLMGYKCYVDTGAIAWHAPAQSGGCRAQDYAQRVQADEFAFRRWVKNNAQALREKGLK